MADRGRKLSNLSAVRLLRKRSHQVDTIYIVVKDKISGFFYAFGVMVGSHPVWFSLVPLFLSIILSFGIFRIRVNNDTEFLFTPVNSRSFGDRDHMRKLFPDSSAWNFDFFALVDVPKFAKLLVRRGGKDTYTTDTFTAADMDVMQIKYNIFDEGVPEVIRSLLKKIKAINVTDNGKVYGFNDICARQNGLCVTDGEDFLSTKFVGDVQTRLITYPRMKSIRGPVDLSFNLGGVLEDEGYLRAARVIQIGFYFQFDKSDIFNKWSKTYQTLMAEEQKNELPYDLQFAYSTSLSVEEELIEGTKGDVLYFACTIILMIVYSILASTGGDMVSTRALLACGGVLAAALGILSALGLLALLGVDFVALTGVMPFLVLGVGVDDMFLLMSTWGESISLEGSVPERVGSTFSKAGIGITITTLTDFLAFLIGVSSSFMGVRYFCIYTALAILFCYLVNCTLFGACLSLHGDRVYAGKHCLTCKPAQSRAHYRQQDAHSCKVYCCGGSIPTRKFEDESLCEQLPRFLLPRIILNPTCKVVVLIGLCASMGVAVYGAIKLEPGMKLTDLVLRSSYYYKYSTWEKAYFEQRLPIAYVVNQEINYAGEDGDVFRRVLNQAQRDKTMQTEFIRCWLHEYSRSPLYPDNHTNNESFMQNLMIFLNTHTQFHNDLCLGPQNKSITCSRCYVLTKKENNIYKQSEIMQRMRKQADEVTEFKMLAYQPAFVMLEHTTAILPSTLSTVGTAVAVMFVVTMAMLPQMLMVCLVTLNIVFIITSVFGSMYFLEITFSGMSMVHILMSVGFSVDFSAHICAAYLMSESTFRKERARYALVHASGPIFNGGLSSLVGVSMLMLSESYFFRSFFKIMSMVITSGAIGAVFFMPIILSYIGPENLDGPMTSHSTRLSISNIQSQLPDGQAPTLEKVLEHEKLLRANSLAFSLHSEVGSSTSKRKESTELDCEANKAAQQPEGNAN